MVRTVLKTAFIGLVSLMSVSSSHATSSDFLEEERTGTSSARGITLEGFVLPPNMRLATV